MSRPGTGALGTYRPGTSLLHRAPAGAKLLGLAGLLLVLALVRSPLGVAAGAGLLAVLAALARIGVRPLLAQARPLRWVLLVLAAFQVWSAGPVTALVVVGSILVAALLAGIVLLTTPTQALLDALVAGLRPFRRLGVDPERAGLVLALTIRAIPVVSGLAQDVVEARRARGVERSARAFAVPLVIRSVRYADRLGEALAARGVGD
ncbi:energy-coupling factor transporter transmembrane protein EcfT [Kineosporia sp. A_224]|uniref:energy-coupling factor transporter transmembrane component T family protein n=1 Tax=Kineosporia sp. A_224 TaxID=1962180 RepID=UPI000B4BF6F0|nr:energy-coupling factor transporter transmembrane protein EcfT [Kineosporia sp. A_224]